MRCMESYSAIHMGPYRIALFMLHVLRVKLICLQVNTQIKLYSVTYVRSCCRMNTSLILLSTGKHHSSGATLSLVPILATDSWSNRFLRCSGCCTINATIGMQLFQWHWVSSPGLPCQLHSAAMCEVNRHFKWLPNGDRKPVDLARPHQCSLSQANQSSAHIVPSLIPRLSYPCKLKQVLASFNLHR